MIRQIAALSLVSLMGLACGPAQAQYSAVYRPTTPFGANYTSTLRSMATLNAYRAIQRASSGDAPATALPSTAKPASATRGPQLPVARTDFRPAGERDAVRKLADSTTLDGAGRAELRTFLRGAVDTIEAQPGFRRHNLANAIGFAIAVSLQTLGGRDLPEQATDNLIRLLNDKLVATGTFARLTDAERTRAYDSFMTVGAVVGSLAEKAKQTGDAKMAAQAREMASETLRGFGFV